MFETGQTSTRQQLDFSFVSRSLKRYSTKSSSFERTTRLVEHRRALYCMRACAVEVDEITHKQEFKMAEGEKQNEIEETQQNKATNGRTKGRKWSDQETNHFFVTGRVFYHELLDDIIEASFLTSSSDPCSCFPSRFSLIFLPSFRRSFMTKAAKHLRFFGCAMMAAENSAMIYVISMETRVELWVILTHNSLFRNTCRVVV